MLKLDHVGKSYGDVQALSDISLEVGPGEIFGYVGPNGAGKTTTIRIITGMIASYRGTVSLRGIDTRAGSRLLQKSIGYVPQDAGFQEWRTVDHALTTFARLSGIPREEVGERVERVLDETGIAEHKSRRIVHLSGGTVQRLRLAQALLHEPEILVLDEPLSGLDPASRHHVNRVIKNLASRNRAILVSSHILAELEGLATTIGVLHNGTIAEHGTPAELRERHNVGTVIRLDLGAPLVPDQIESLSRNPVQRMQKSGDLGILLHLNSGTSIDDAMPELLGRIVHSRVPVRSVSHVQPSLEDVYLKLISGAIP